MAGKMSYDWLVSKFYPRHLKYMPLFVNIPLPIGRNQHAYYQTA